MNLAANLELKNEAAASLLAGRLALHLKSPLVLGFSGEIGVGKTTFIRALLRALAVQSAIKSPTFSLVESYFLPDFVFHHFDLYRIHEEEELDYIGFREYFGSDTICCIEWPEKASQSIGLIDLHFSFGFRRAGRSLGLKAATKLGAELGTVLLTD